MKIKRSQLRLVVGRLIAEAAEAAEGYGVVSSAAGYTPGERRLTDDSYKNSVYTAARLTPEEITLTNDTIESESDVDFHGTGAYYKLYGYFLDEQEMPIEIARAQTGDPAEWVIDRLQHVDPK